uniref:Reverse transcriptase Ty1/copia-type domain-containing protein n=1 Tax=Solanum lycopersicum TaxID=4081 RepID=A0A3Q7EXG2_SOLLC
MAQPSWFISADKTTHIYHLRKEQHLQCQSGYYVPYFSLSIKDLGNLHYFLGVEVLRNSGGLIFTQENYVNDILNDDLMTLPLLMTLIYICTPIHLYLRVTPIDDFNLHMYSNTDWGGDITNRVLASDYILFADHNLISWS